MTHVLVQYGRSGFVGRFATPLDVPRGSAVVVRTPRGVELGTALGPVHERFAGQIDDSAGGEVMRIATPDDDGAAERSAELAAEIVAAAEQAGQPVAFLDCEVTLDRRGAVLHAVAWDTCDLDPLLVNLSDRFGLAVRLMDVSRTPTLQDPPEPKTTCDKSDCGTGEGNCSTGGCGTGGGCSTGSCSKGSVKSAEELTAYFADLRRQMEATGRQALN